MESAAEVETLRREVEARRETEELQQCKLLQSAEAGQFLLKQNEELQREVEFLRQELAERRDEEEHTRTLMEQNSWLQHECHCLEEEVENLHQQLMRAQGGNRSGPEGSDDDSQWASESERQASLRALETAHQRNQEVYEEMQHLESENKQLRLSVYANRRLRVEAIERRAKGLDIDDSCEGSFAASEMLATPRSLPRSKNGLDETSTSLRSGLSGRSSVATLMVDHDEWNHWSHMDTPRLWGHSSPAVIEEMASVAVDAGAEATDSVSEITLKEIADDGSAASADAAAGMRSVESTSGTPFNFTGPQNQFLLTRIDELEVALSEEKTKSGELVKQLAESQACNQENEVCLCSLQMELEHEQYSSQALSEQIAQLTFLIEQQRSRQGAQQMMPLTDSSEAKHPASLESVGRHGDFGGGNSLGGTLRRTRSEIHRGRFGRVLSNPTTRQRRNTPAGSSSGAGKYAATGAVPPPFTCWPTTPSALDSSTRSPAGAGSARYVWTPRVRRTLADEVRGALTLGGGDEGDGDQGGSSCAPSFGGLADSSAASKSDRGRSRPQSIVGRAKTIPIAPLPLTSTVIRAASRSIGSTARSQNFHVMRSYGAEAGACQDLTDGFGDVSSASVVRSVCDDGNAVCTPRSRSALDNSFQDDDSLTTCRLSPLQGSAILETVESFLTATAAVASAAESRSESWQQRSRTMARCTTASSMTSKAELTSPSDTSRWPAACFPAEKNTSSDVLRSDRTRLEEPWQLTPSKTEASFSPSDGEEYRETQATSDEGVSLRLSLLREETKLPEGSVIEEPILPLTPALPIDIFDESSGYLQLVSENGSAGRLPQAYRRSVVLPPSRRRASAGDLPSTVSTDTARRSSRRSGFTPRKSILDFLRDEDSDEDVPPSKST
eukprot:TRINITY_DN67522_c0_g1_i1.p1 TRINITY_DN67522_c0_g1~~TRINITY_DN67522_c0_g1_i1.p1  ORF type:complete len:897 (+),score=159.74 TRINITY_DN67522_c0_g1_i1:83-2773(+)